MDELVKSLTKEMEADLGVRLPKAPFSMKDVGNGKEPEKTTLSQQIDVLISGLNTRVELLKRLKESL